jgi:hypothetical protein
VILPNLLPCSHLAVTLLQARLRAMEGKILKGEARGGLVQVTRKKEEQLARREQELQRRWALTMTSNSFKCMHGCRRCCWSVARTCMFPAVL